MDPVAAAVTALGVIVTAYLGYKGQRLLARRAKAAEETQAVQQSAVLQVDVMREIREARKDDAQRIDQLDERLRATEKGLRDERLRRETLAQHLDDERREREKLSSLYARLELRFQEAVTYIRALLDRLREHDDHPELPEWLVPHIPRREDDDS